jgi:hypothetical protein
MSGRPPAAEQGTLPGGPNTPDAAAEVALQAYRSGRRSMVVGSLLVAVPSSLLVAIGSRTAAVALAVGVVCGIINSLLSMQANERLANHRSVSLFVLSSVLRVLVFGIVPVGLSLHGPWWPLVSYFAGFFTPLALFARSVARAPQTN